MSDAAWLIVALTAGAAFSALWVARELWIHRRRRRARRRASQARRDAD